jgi:hypothetical protein
MSSIFLPCIFLSIRPVANAAKEIWSAAIYRRFFAWPQSGFSARHPEGACPLHKYDTLHIFRLARQTFLILARTRDGREGMRHEGGCQLSVVHQPGKRVGAQSSTSLNRSTKFSSAP